MKRAPSDSLRARLARLTLVAVVLSVVVTVMIIAIFEITTFRPRALESAKRQAELIADIIVPAVEFNDANTARKILSVLRHQSAVEAASVYLADGSQLAAYERDEVRTAPPASARGGNDRIVGRKALVSADVNAEGVTIGRVWLQAGLPGWGHRARQYAPALLIVAVTVVGLSWFIVLATRREITDPIHELAETVRKIGTSQNLELRVAETDQGEVGELAHSFNEMLSAVGERDRLLQEREARLVRHNAGLSQLNRTDLDDESGFLAALQGITKLVAEGQEVERVSVWFLDSAGGTLECADLYHRGERMHTTGHRIERAAHPGYFVALEAPGTLEVTDAAKDPRTREFASGYLRTHKVGAMLDAPIRWRGRLVGVLCHEHVGGAREWHADEVALAEIFANRIAHLMERRETMRADIALRESDARYRELISQAQDAIFTLSMDGRIESVNDAARRITGWEPGTWKGHRFQDVIVREDVPLAEEVFASVAAGDMPPRFELRVLSSSGGQATFEFAVSPQRREGKVVGLLGIGRDVTERKHAAEARARLEEQLRHSQKMEAVGTMAGGIAHDFNNILTAIIGNAELAELDTDPEHPASECLSEILVASRRAKELVRQILAFSRRQDQVLASVALDQIVAESLKLLRPVLSSTVRIDTRLPSGIPAVLADATQLQQVVVNLATNAAHAMEEKGGRLELAIDEVEVDIHMAALEPELKPGRFVRLSVTDNGIGMTPAVRAKIFDPFFTTKPKGKGTGLGLAVVHGIVRQHGGMIRVYSAQGEGTTFQVYVPVAESAPVVVPVENDIVVDGNGESILLVDDEAQVISVASEILRRHGYRTECFQNPALALEAFRERPGEWRLVITDQLMPEMKGTALAAELWNIREDVPIILATGFAGNFDEKAVGSVGFSGLLQKPFSRVSLLSIVSRALGGAGRAV